MPRRAKKNNDRSNQVSFRFEWVDWPDKRLAELRGWLDGNDHSLQDAVQQLADSGWKVSCSENQRTGRYLVSISDKASRKGCSGVSWGIEHSDIKNAYLGALYYAIEIIGDGIENGPAYTDSDLW